MLRLVVVLLVFVWDALHISMQSFNVAGQNSLKNILLYKYQTQRKQAQHKMRAQEQGLQHSDASF